MNHIEKLLFVGECLTLDLYPEKVERIRNSIRSKEFELEQIIWQASNHLVLPAFYLNLKRAGLLSELPDDLIQYLEEITSLNRERNIQIIKQAKEITSLLNQHNISPVFLKGTAHLLKGLYTDIAERMVGDIDFLVDEHDVIRAAEILFAEGYSLLKGNKVSTVLHRHYPRLVKSNAIAGVEIHRRVVKKSFEKHFHFDLLNKNKTKLDITGEAYIISSSHQLIYNMMIVQINDNGYYRGIIYLRQMYDLLLLSNNKDTLKIIQEYGHYFHKLNICLALSSKFMGNPKNIIFEENKKTKRYLAILFFFYKHTKLFKAFRIVIYLGWRFLNYFIQIAQSFYKKEMRMSLYNRLSNPSWYKKYLLSYKKMS